MADYNILQVLEASTGNVSFDTMTAIENHELTVAVLVGSYGAFVWVGDEAPLIEREGKHKDLHPLLELAREKKCDWLYLDPDADPIEGLPFYDW